ncbi:MAG: YsnF/AvaK domain-containing protein [Anaerolineae bacterium]|nr:YsnF/AvaK domain-containing protein [Anaerolineae bacterium]
MDRTDQPGEKDQREEIAIPVVAEKLQVEKEAVARGTVRIRKTVHEHEETVDVPLSHEEVQVERVPVNRMIEGDVQVRYDGDTMIIPIVEEVLVVETRLMLKEELHITKRRVTENHPQTVTLRSEEATVEHLPEAQAKAGKDRT